MTQEERFDTALALYGAEMYGEAFLMLKALAEEGYSDPEALVALGDCYCHGEGVDMDYREAMVWYAKAAEMGHDFAQKEMGDCYFFGKGGMPQDFRMAVEWWGKSAGQGNYGAQFNLGSCYCNGEGVSKDYAKAAAWYRKAAEQGFGMAQEQLEKLKNEGKI